MSRVNVSLTFFFLLLSHILALTLALSLLHQGSIVTFACVCVGVNHLTLLSYSRPVHFTFYSIFSTHRVSIFDLHLHLTLLLRYFCDHFRSRPLDSPSTHPIMWLSLSPLSYLLFSCLSLDERKRWKSFLQSKTSVMKTKEFTPSYTSSIGNEMKR